MVLDGADTGGRGGQLVVWVRGEATRDDVRTRRHRGRRDRGRTDGPRDGPRRVAARAGAHARRLALEALADTFDADRGAGFGSVPSRTSATIYSTILPA